MFAKKVLGVFVRRNRVWGSHPQPELLLIEGVDLTGMHYMLETNYAEFRSDFLIKS